MTANSDQEHEKAMPRSCNRDSTPNLVAIDLGADSCRVSLLRWSGGAPIVQLVHRFPNAPVRENDSLRWDLRRICAGVEEGLRACAKLAPEGIDAIGVDGWAVDYVRLGSDGEPIANPFCYRDERTTAALKQVHARISPERLYELTGVQILGLNTLYQLYADTGAAKSASWLNLPEFILYFLGGSRAAEYTNATHTQLLGIGNRSWCDEVFAAAELDRSTAPAVVPPGSDVGMVKGALARLPAFRNTRLIAPACHDTASAIAGIEAEGDDWAFISSGTWSLVGCVLDSPCLSAAAREGNFSNEGGVGGKINFLKNVNGLWLLQQCIKTWRSTANLWDVETLVQECASLRRPTMTIEVDDPELLLPGDMPARINACLQRKGCSPITKPPEMANLIFHSLAARYAAVLRDLTNITGRNFRRVVVVGGGNKNSVLSRLTAEATGLKVVIGSSESATVGNFAVQLAALIGDYSSQIGVSSAAVARWAGRVACGISESVQLESAVS
jgi:rhamnulokinase